MGKLGLVYNAKKIAEVLKPKNCAGLKFYPLNEKSKQHNIKLIIKKGEGEFDEEDTDIESINIAINDKALPDSADDKNEFVIIEKKEHENSQENRINESHVLIRRDKFEESIYNNLFKAAKYQYSDEDLDFVLFSKGDLLSISSIQLNYGVRVRKHSKNPLKLPSIFNTLKAESIDRRNENRAIPNISVGLPCPPDWGMPTTFYSTPVLLEEFGLLGAMNDDSNILFNQYLESLFNK